MRNRGGFEGEGHSLWQTAWVTAKVQVVDEPVGETIGSPDAQMPGGVEIRQLQAIVPMLNDSSVRVLACEIRSQSLEGSKVAVLDHRGGDQNDLGTELGAQVDEPFQERVQDPPAPVKVVVHQVAGDDRDGEGQDETSVAPEDRETSGCLRRATRGGLGMRDDCRVAGRHAW